MKFQKKLALLGFLAPFLLYFGCQSRQINNTVAPVGKVQTAISQVPMPEQKEEKIEDTPSPTPSQTGNPNGPKNKRQPGWTLWHPLNHLPAGISYGFSNITSGLGNDMKAACTQAAKGKTPLYWYRLNDMLRFTGNGEIQIGCWLDGKFIKTWTIDDAIKEGWEWSKPVNCTPAKPSQTALRQSPEKSKLTQELLSTKECNNCNLQGVILQNAALQSANLSKTNLKNANLKGASLKEAYLFLTNFAQADISNAKLQNVSATASNFKNANLFAANLQQANLDRANLSCTNLQNANLQGANLSSANLLGANLQGATLKKTDFSLAAIDKTTKIDKKWRLVAQIINEKAEKRNLSQINLSDAYLVGVYLEKANLKGANLKSVDLGVSKLKGANLEGADLANASLKIADLRGAILKKANLTGANLEGANLSNANLKGAKLNKTNLQDTNLCNAIMPDGSKSNQGCK